MATQAAEVSFGRRPGDDPLLRTAGSFMPYGGTSPGKIPRQAGVGGGIHCGVCGRPQRLRYHSLGPVHRHQKTRAASSNGTRSCAKQPASSRQLPREAGAAASRPSESLLELQVAANQHDKVFVTKGESRARSSFPTSAPVARLLVSKEVYRHQVVSFPLIRLRAVRFKAA